jgi:pyruvate carboxylase
VGEAAEAGIDVFRIFDSLNWIEGMKVAITAALETGRLVEAALCYSGDCADPAEDVYTLDYYVGLGRQVRALGVHLIAIKDMAGLLRPASARLLVGALRTEVGLPVHLHTHDSAGCGVAAILAAADAGAAVADVASASMAGGTSQPSMTAVVAALRDTPRDTGLDLAACDRAAEAWAGRRALYAGFEAPPGASATRVYEAEMPGGQYTNLRAQAEAVGLGARWPEVVGAYREVDRLLGRIVKVTPSSKAVGDFALFLVGRGLAASDLSEERLATPDGRAAAERLDFPESVVQLLGGQMGQPARGFPPLLQAVCCRGRQPLQVRPGAVLPPADLEAEARRLGVPPGEAAGRREVLSSLLYPGPAGELRAHARRFGDTSVLDTATFFGGMRPGDEIEARMEPGKTLVIRLTAIGEADSDGRRTLHFELNGTPRAISVIDQAVGVGGTARPSADPTDAEQVGSPMAGRVLRLLVERGAQVAAGAPLLALEAMKMETVVSAPHAGRVTALPVVPGDSVRPGDLLAVVRAGN